MPINKATRAELWPALNPGTLRHQVQIQSVSATPDAFGQPQQTWTTVRTTWARIEEVSLAEKFQVDQLTSAVTHRIICRYTPAAVQAGMRVVFGSHIYKIQAVANVEQRNVILRLDCLELNATE